MFAKNMLGMGTFFSKFTPNRSAGRFFPLVFLFLSLSILYKYI